MSGHKGRCNGDQELVPFKPEDQEDASESKLKLIFTIDGRLMFTLIVPQVPEIIRYVTIQCVDSLSTFLGNNLQPVYIRNRSPISIKWQLREYGQNGSALVTHDGQSNLHFDADNHFVELIPRKPRFENDPSNLFCIGPKFPSYIIPSAEPQQHIQYNSIVRLTSSTGVAVLPTVTNIRSPNIKYNIQVASDSSNCSLQQVDDYSMFKQPKLQLHISKL